MSLNDGIILFLIGVALTAWSFVGLFAFLLRDIFAPKKLTFKDYFNGGPIVWMLVAFVKIGELFGKKK